MELDLFGLGIICLAFIVFVPLAFFIGRARDIVWRAKMIRRYLKQNSAILEIVSKDGKTRTARLVNMDNDLLTVGENMWVIKKNRIYRKDKVETGAPANYIKWEEGVPIIAFDEDSIKPLDYYKEEATVKPDELGSTMGAWVMNQLAKGFAAIKNQDLLMKIILVCVVINLLLSYTGMDNSGKTLEAVQGQPAQAGQVPAGGTVQADGSIVIKQPGIK